MNRRGMLRGAAALGLSIGGSSVLTVKGQGSDLTKVTLQLGWLASDGVLGETVAMKKGFFADEGLELEIVLGGPNIDGVAGVASGQQTSGQTSSSPAVMLARSAGIPVKAFAAGFQKHPFTFFSLSDAPIREPKDMIGKTVATQPTAVILVKALLAKNNIDPSQVNVVNMGSDMNQLMTGQVQAVTGWLTNVNALKVIGDKRVDMSLWDTGIHLYANVYFSTDKIISEQPKILEAYVRATARGWGYARKNREEAVDILVATYPILDRASELKAVGSLMDFSFTDVTKTEGWGAMNRDNWAAQLSTYKDLKQFTNSVPTVDDVMTTAILDATLATRQQVAV
ncbi:MAG TPA: ABC transporter substrate-binding protein [Devosiaceae bacterium]|nr:ABC transporter substrate-binding protein [Devosiaceae bacterium]